jgi:hypothetical protein
MKTKKRVSTRKSVALPEGVSKRLTAYAQAAGAALPEDVNKRLTAYALAAGAAGVGVLALVEPARADIITVTTPIPLNCCNNQYTWNGFTPLVINGKDVLNFSNSFTIFPTGRVPSGVATGQTLRILPSRGVAPGAGVLVGPLAKGALIGPRQPFAGSAFLEGVGGHATSHGGFVRGGTGPWYGKSGYLGFKFLSNSKTYFGWAHLIPPTAGGRGPRGGSISEFAYDTVPGQAIEAGQTSAIPEPGTLSLLALGAAGVAALRRRKRSAASRQGPPDS